MDSCIGRSKIRYAVNKSIQSECGSQESSALDS